MRQISFILLILTFFTFSCNLTNKEQYSPSVDTFSKPWTYWWWHGSTVTKAGITHHLEAFQKAGIGGVHIIPIYGVTGMDDKEIAYLSDTWIEMLQHCIDEAKRLKIKVDMTSGTGWPFGGPEITNKLAAKKIMYQKFELSGGKKSSLKIAHTDSSSSIIAVIAQMNDTIFEPITQFVDTARILQWDAPKGKWQIHVAYSNSTGMKVKRAAPGGEGNVIDYFSENAILQYMKKFEKALSKIDSNRIFLRSFYNDSYEQGQANWTDSFFVEFKNRRNYDFRPYFYLLFNPVSNDTTKRIITDYHETINDLLHDNFTKKWAKWCLDHNVVTRNQAHGSPANWLDLYYAADIPETESFGASDFNIPNLRTDNNFDVTKFYKPDIRLMKFASSTANLKNTRLVSSETATWLAEHFKVSLSQVKPQIDELFTAGVNHIFYHGIAYSPKNEEFPGRLFYASTNFGFNSHLWNDLPELNQYIANCQKWLQNTKHDNQILVYFPVYDFWSNPELQKSDNQIITFTVHDTKIVDSNFGKTIDSLTNYGYCFDYVSDNILNKLATNKNIDIKHTTIVIPPCDFMPEETLKNLQKLIKQRDLKIVFHQKMPDSVPGFFNYQTRQKEFDDIKNKIKENQACITSKNIYQDLQKMAIKPEEFPQKNIRFIRKSWKNGKIYFVTNLDNQFSADSVILKTNAQAVEFYNPLTQKRGFVNIKHATDSLPQIYLQLQTGQSLFIITHNDKTDGKKWHYHTPSQEFKITGKWKINFTDSFPKQPKPYETSVLKSWTNFSHDNTLKYYYGTAEYLINFKIKDDFDTKQTHLLKFENLRETAEVWLNGQNIGKVWSIPYQIEIPENTLKKDNELKIIVRNLSFNYIRYLDKNKVEWKKFKDINFVNIKYEPFDASQQVPEESGIIGRVWIE